MDVARELERLGGIAGRKALLAVTTRGEVERAVERGEIRRVGRGRFALPTDIEARAAAHALKGTAVLLSAAAHWGWACKWTPRRPQVAVPKGRKVSPAMQKKHDVRWRSVPLQDVYEGWVTSKARTLIDCAILLPFDEALAVADSALRGGLTRADGAELKAMMRTVPVQHRRRVNRVMGAAVRDASGPFESVLRAIALDVSDLTVQTQVRIDDADGWIGRVDLADVSLHLVLEADSMEYHGERSLQDRDCARYTRLTSSGWLVLRFTWEQVMHRPDWVRAQIAAAVHVRQQQRSCCLPENYTPGVA